MSNFSAGARASKLLRIFPSLLKGLAAARRRCLCCLVVPVGCCRLLVQVAVLPTSRRLLWSETAARNTRQEHPASLCRFPLFYIFILYFILFFIDCQFSHRQGWAHLDIQYRQSAWPPYQPLLSTPRLLAPPPPPPSPKLFPAPPVIHVCDAPATDRQTDYTNDARDSNFFLFVFGSPTTIAFFFLVLFLSPILTRLY